MNRIGKLFSIHAITAFSCRVFAAPLQRLRDWLLEREIKATKRIAEDCMAKGESKFEAFFMRDYYKLIAKRSPQQLARMKGRGE